MYVSGIQKLHLNYKYFFFQRLEYYQTWEVLSNYLLYAFRGPAESLKKISEFKLNAVLSDVFCFYYRERMFLLKCLRMILNAVNDEQTPHSVSIYFSSCFDLILVKFM